MSNEQDFHNFLKGLTSDSLIQRAKDIEISTFNQEIEQHMIRNILLNRGLYVPTHFVSDFEYGKFYKMDITGSESCIHLRNKDNPNLYGCSLGNKCDPIWCNKKERCSEYKPTPVGYHTPQ